MKARRRQPTWLSAFMIFLFATFTLMAGVLVFVVVRELTTVWTGVGLNPFQAVGGATRSPETPGIPGDLSGNLDPQVTPIPWNGKSRVTILLLGLDFRDWQQGVGAPRSDSMMLVSIDPITRQAGMLSIPRDLWVEIPGFGFNRINAAYAFGEGYRLPGGGPALAMQTVENVIGVPIQYYAVIEFSTFERLIDEIGGIDVLVHQRVKISPIGKMSRWLEAKPYHLDGADALAYARVRKAAGGDFGRAERQQQVALAVLDRVVGFDMVPTLVKKAPQLYQELSSGVRTNMTLEQMISLGWLVVRIPKGNITRGVIGPPNMVGFYTRPDGAQVLRLVPDQIRILRDQIFVDTSAIGPTVPTPGANAETP